MSTTEERWLRKKAHYQDPRVVREYDELRFSGGHQRGSTGRKWRAIEKALGPEFDTARSWLDVPCGTGRFTRPILAAHKLLIGADISQAMLQATSVAAGADPRLRALVRCEVERLPFADGAFDVVLSIRFLLHVPRGLRAGMLRELARVSRRWVIVDVRHKYCYATHSRRLRAWLARRPPPSARSSLREIDADVSQAGLVLKKRVWLAPFFSEKMLLVCEKA